MVQVARFQVGAPLQQPIHHGRIAGVMQRCFAIAAALVDDGRVLGEGVFEPIEPALFGRRVRGDLGAALDELAGRLGRGHFEDVEIARPPLRPGIDIGAMLQQDIHDIDMFFDDDKRGRAEKEMRVVYSRLQARVGRQEFVEFLGVFGVDQLLELFEGIAVIMFLQLDSQAQLAPALGAVLAGDDRLRLADGEWEGGRFSARAVFDLRQMLVDAIDGVGVAGLEGFREFRAA